MRVVSYTIRKLEHLRIVFPEMSSESGGNESVSEQSSSSSETLGYKAPVWVDAVKLPGGVIYRPENAEGVIREKAGVFTEPTSFILVAQSSNGREDIIGGEVQLNP